MNLRIISLLAAVLLVAACSQTPENTAGTGNAGAGTGAMTSNVVPGSKQDFQQNVGDRMFFEFNESTITPEGRATLEKQAEWLKRYAQVSVTIEGHCDERGTREYNLALGDRRANAAKNYLVSLGVPASRLTTISYGKERPVALGSDEASWAKNRRAVTIVLQ